MTPRQQRFVDEYLIDLNATQAAIRAEYSKKTAASQGERLLRNADVAAAIAEAKTERSEITKIDAAWVLTRLSEEAVADIADLYTDDGKLKPVAEWPLIWRQGLVSGLDVDEIKLDGAKLGQVTKIKLSDRVKRLELIGKHVDVQAFADRHEHTGKDGGPIETKELSTTEAARRIAFALAKATQNLTE